jgi:RNA polymerase sigma-70 factor (ECF subfamily)
LNEERLRSLLIQGLAGDASAYHVLLSELATYLRAYLRRRLTRMPQEIEDLVQELLLAIHNQRHTYDQAQPLSAWVHAIARYKTIDLLRRRSRHEALDDPLDDATEVFTVADSEAAEAQYDLSKLLQELPDRQRLPILYVKIEGGTVTEAAERTGMSESAVKVGIHRGLKALATRIRTRA